MRYSIGFWPPDQECDRFPHLTDEQTKNSVVVEGTGFRADHLGLNLAGRAGASCLTPLGLSFHICEMVITAPTLKCGWEKEAGWSV